MTKPRILILGGTTEARRLADLLAGQAVFDTVLSLAGRTADPLPQPVPVRVGGFGGIEGLADYLTAERINLLIDATHPFAAKISVNAAEAAKLTDVTAIALRRPGWKPQPGDRWRSVHSMADAVDALGSLPLKVFLSIGRQEAHYFNRAPQHRYLVRSIDPVDPPLDMPDVSYILSAGPFDRESETRLLRENGIDILVTKNSGGRATYAKIEAARDLGLNIVMVERATPPDMLTFETVEAAFAHIYQVPSPVVKRGV